MTAETEALRAALTAAGYETQLGVVSGLIFVRNDPTRDPPSLPAGWRLVPTASSGQWYVILPPST